MIKFNTYEEYETYIKEFITDTMLKKVIYRFWNKEEKEIFHIIFNSYIRNELSKNMRNWLFRKFINSDISYMSNLDYCIDAKDEIELLRDLEEDNLIFVREEKRLTIIYHYRRDEINSLKDMANKKALASYKKAKATT